MPDKALDDQRDAAPAMVMLLGERSLAAREVIPAWWTLRLLLPQIGPTPVRISLFNESSSAATTLGTNRSVDV